MGRKFEVTGKAVIYTQDGAKVVDAEVRRYFNAHTDCNNFKISNELSRKLDDKFLLIGGARTILTDNQYAMPAYHPETVDFAFHYAQTKFFKLMIKLMRLAQWNPIHKFNIPIHSDWFRNNQFIVNQKPDIDFTKTVDDIDKQFYRKYGFTTAMIKFTEENFP